MLATDYCLLTTVYSILHVRADGGAIQAVLKQLLHDVAHMAGIAAAEAEAVALDGSQVRVNSAELFAGRLRPRLAQGRPDVHQVAVAAAARADREPLLVAFIVKTPDASWTALRLRHALRANLPLHMVPSRIVFLDKLPYNRANKIDRAALRQHPLPIRDVAKGDEPRTETERWLAEIWAEILEIPSIGREDDFFSLGGDSLMGASLAAHVYTSVGVELSLGGVEGVVISLPVPARYVLALGREFP